MPLQELLQIDVDAEGRVRRRRRSWSSASSPQHLKAPGHLLQHHPLGTENNSGTNNNNDDVDFLPPPPPAVKDLGIASRSQTLDDYGEDAAAPRDLAGNGNASDRARQGQGSTNDNIRLALLRSRGNVPSLAGRAHDEEEEDDHDHSEILSNVDMRRDLDDDAYDSDTLRDIDDLLSPQGSALLDHHDVYEEEDDDDDDDDGDVAGDEASHASNGHGHRQVPGPKDAVFARRISHPGDVQTDGGHSEAEVKAENVTPSRGRRFDFASTASDDSTVDILNLINVSRQKRSERRRKGLDRMLTPESVSKHLRTRSDTDICGSAEKSARRKAVSTKGWKAFGSRDHPPRLSTLRKVVSSSRSLAATAEASQKALAQRKRRQQLQDQDDLLLDTGAAETPAESTSQVKVKEKSPSSPTTATTQKSQAWSMVDILRWALVLTLWAIAIVNPHLIVDLSRAMTGATVSVSAPASSSRADAKPPVELAPVRAPQVKLEEDMPKPSDVDEKPVRSVERKITQQPRADEQPTRFVMPTEPARVEFAYPNADGASVPQAGVTLRLKFFHLFPEQLALHRNPRLCMRLSNGGEDTLLGCVPVKDAQMEVSLKSLQLGPTRVVATLVSEAKKLGRAARQMNVVLMDPVPEDRAPQSTTTTTTETTTDNDTQERCVTTCSRTCTMTYEM